MTLLEREGLLAQLEASWAGAREGPGRLVFIEGEAGIGKTSLLRSFVQSGRGGDAPVRYWGACEAMLRPRPLGPLEDVALQSRGELAALLASAAPRHRLFAAFVELLAERPTLAVLEDLHWADEATLDLLRYAGRRIARTHSLLLASLRSDELVPAHPLRVVLGDLATSGALRLTLPPLSPAAVSQLCGERGFDAAELHRTTGGNPFFVTEVLAAGEHSVPATVQDAVLARAARLAPAARAVLDAAAVAGPRVEPCLLQDLTAADSAAIDECLATGVLRAEEAAFSFRHELARQAVLCAITPTRKMSLHRGVLRSLLSSSTGSTEDGERTPIPADPARLALHAHGAGDASAVRHWAPLAARHAAARGAHHQACELWKLALEPTHADAERAPMLDAYAVECRICGRMPDALAAQGEALDAWRRLGDIGREAMALARVGLWQVAAARKDEGEAAMRDALALLASPGVAAAVSIFVRQQAAAVRMMDHDTDGALALAGEVLMAAERESDGRAIVQAHIVIGTSLLCTERSDTGNEHLQLALAGAQAQHDDVSISSTLLNLGSANAENHQLVAAEQWLRRGIAFCSERDFEMSRLYQRAWLATVQLHQGRWDDAGAAAEDVLADGRAAAVARITALIALGRLRARRGEPGVWELLDEARTLALGTSSLQRLAPMHAARAEAAWLEGRAADAALEARAGLPLALAKRVPAFAAELLAWCRRSSAGEAQAGAPQVPDYCTNHPFGLEAAGQWRQAAQAWALRQCRYEAACAQAFSGEPAQQREALTTFEALGAKPMIERVRLRLRQAGVRDLPRGPRASTRQHPAGLTAKEAAVLALLVSGLRNKEIAQRLSRSARTIDHHLESIFAKLGVTNRSEAVSAAHALGVMAESPRHGGARPRAARPNRTP
jgi:DNA-binding CsgD family transcriptional regulator/tetratricopeptide (TPR) repeat protein